MKRHGLLAAAVVLVLVGVGFVGELRGQEIDACFKPATGNLRLRTPSSPNCLPSEMPISWNRQGPPGSCDVTPPVITATLTCQGVFDVILGLTIWDDDEVGFFAIQKQGTDPALNHVYSVEPDVQTVVYGITLGVGPVDESYLILASDMEGNIAKALVEVPADFCQP
jgi:hypothetical protein